MSLLCNLIVFSMVSVPLSSQCALLVCIHEFTKMVEVAETWTCINIYFNLFWLNKHFSLLV